MRVSGALASCFTTDSFLSALAPERASSFSTVSEAKSTTLKDGAFFLIAIILFWASILASSD